MVTRKDIAERAGVSVSVVSRAINNSGYVEKEKKRKILQIAEQLGYRPNPVAVSLSSQRTKQILFYCRELENGFNIEMYEGMLEQAHKHGYMVVLRGQLDFDSIRNVMVDGLILPNEHVTKLYLAGGGRNYHLPAVSAAYGNAVQFKKSVPVIECDLWEGVHIAMKYLQERGHRRVAMIMPYGMDSESRSRAWRECIIGCPGICPETYYIGINKECLPGDGRLDRFEEERVCDNVLIPEAFFEKGRLAAEIFLERRLDATAALCFNDEMALGFYHGLTALGLRIPQDVSVMGIDGSFARRYAGKQLTTLNLHPGQIGMRCMETLLKMINGEKYSYVSRIKMDILEGETVRTL